MNTTSYRILLIEDDPGVAASLVDGLERDGFEVIWKANGAEGTQAANNGLVHLVLLDVRLPDGSGFDVCRELRRLGLHQPVIMLTVQKDEMDKVLGLEMGADDYVTKPFSLRELLSRIRAQLRRAYGEFANGNEQQVIVVRDLVVDQNRGQVLRGEQVLSLSPTEFRLFIFLAQQRGRVVTRTQIIEAVWGYAPDLESERAVNVHIRRLREKVEIDPSSPVLILTVPGIGYRLAG
ncbi:MAG: DNA-binding response regulator [Chloroflexi bacterium HGW-Chloroflexi-10]|nr:MAG: DNA-binding response regulator [Chloroflexi bacterium HGW-Chloroflexi-10]